ncbi:hypothetical protein N7456_003245 [Penicillium angulare]|uniref:Uncharacterized protein n=1 Tax=Penicillium angulare TaxID=116970 RepID=A0A9W9FUB2_9EURO|nr:hypothetical protein N7456_003245 [Penicillium angulare]
MDDSLPVNMNIQVPRIQMSGAHSHSKIPVDPALELDQRGKWQEQLVNYPLEFWERKRNI